MNINDSQLSEKSCFDFQISSDKETEFLENYFSDLLTDNCSSFLSTTIYQQLVNTIQDKSLIIKRYLKDQIQLQIDQNLHTKCFYLKNELSISQLTYLFRRMVSRMEILSNTNSTASKSLDKSSDLINKNDLMEVFQNKNMIENQILKVGEFVYIDIKLKMTNFKLKSVLQNVVYSLKKQFNYPNTETQESFLLTFQNYYVNPFITIILFVNGDVNFDYEKYSNYNDIEINQIIYRIKIKIYYISFCKIFNSFMSVHQYQFDIIDQKKIAFYELKRYGQLKININKTITELLKMEQKHNQSNLIIPFLIITTITIGISYYFYRNKKLKLNQKQS